MVPLLRFPVFSYKLYQLSRDIFASRAVRGRRQALWGLTWSLGQMKTEGASGIRLWCSNFSWESMVTSQLACQRFLLEDGEVLMFTFTRCFFAYLSVKPRNGCGPRTRISEPLAE